MATARRLVQESQAESLDFLVLPEMAFTGYLFLNSELADVLAEETSSGPTFDWAAEHARRLNCGVLVGFIRRGEDKKLYNSLMIVDPQGKLVTCYDKTFLFEADKAWAEAGKGFSSFECSWLDNLRVGVGICMDINPKDFVAPWGAFELANFHKEAKCDLVILSSAWCNRHPNDPVESPINGPETINYWASRLRPLIGTSTHFVVANRVGSEPATLIRPDSSGNVTFVGSSCAISLHEPMLVDALRTDEERLLLVSLPCRSS
eukprot:CAMPEP_0184526118 /NCGR_PEP_ID=MMETSP0198_2-20121128/10479_1 /TAXON_ID=1112570 /ORGANISM="Thraustochytrium sp., Strain LLF1b" /LENGTH=261 /DNA_ID=CAMNT_0026917659 /DNA_START=170 /DNA_END=952 /DNA_ORIENTATION=-